MFLHLPASVTAAVPPTFPVCPVETVRVLLRTVLYLHLFISGPFVSKQTGTDMTSPDTHPDWHAHARPPAAGESEARDRPDEHFPVVHDSKC